MKNGIRSNQSGNRRSVLITAACALLALGAVAAVARPLGQAQTSGCQLQGSWLAQVDIGGIFFVQYSGASAAGGALTIEWIKFDPTLFGSFPAAVRVTNGAGSWNKTDDGYAYTWVAYGIDAAGAPVYSVKTSGKGALQGCDVISFDYTVEVFPASMDPLSAQPVTCLSGTGTKRRVVVASPSCP